MSDDETTDAELEKHRRASNSTEEHRDVIHPDMVRRLFYTKNETKVLS